MKISSTFSTKRHCDCGGPICLQMTVTVNLLLSKVVVENQSPCLKVNNYELK